MLTTINYIHSRFHDSDKWHQQYPWFSTGFLIDAALKKNKPGFSEAAQKAAIYFNDVHRFHWLLHEEEPDISAILSEYKPDETAFDSREDDTDTGETLLLPESTAERVKNDPGENVEDDAENIAKVGVAEIQELQIEDLDDAPVGDSDEPIVSAREETISNPVISGAQSFDSEDQNAELVGPRMIDDNAAETSGVTAAPAGPLQTSFEEGETPFDEDGPLPEEKLPDTPYSQHLSQALADVSKSFKAEIPADQELVIASEPYHTVDYFASQGIKLELEPKADDKFGQQLKSFTSWLRQMKRLPSAKIAEKEPDPEIEDIASTSLEGGEVVTESMAEVLLKQGKKEQAVDVWKKLSLLHPEKSHYFASLIEKTSL